MNKMKPLLMIMAGALIVLSSCYKDDSVLYDQLDVTLTKYDTEFNFSGYTTFAMSDSVVLKTNYMTDAEIDAFYAPGGPADKTMELVRQKFQDRGYTLVTDSSDVDFVTAPTVLKIRQTGAVYYPPGWWWGYPGWGYPGWGYPGWGYPGYPWHPGYVSYYSYKEGSIVMEMIDGASYRGLVNWFANPTNESPELIIRWMGIIDGYLTGNSDYDAERAARGIDEAFTQSPYLRK